MGTESWKTVTLAESANLCLESFTTCLARFGHLTVREQSAIEDQLGQFSIWSSNIEIFAAGKDSLDYRLSDASHVQRLLRRLLRILNDHIQRLFSAINSRPEAQTKHSRSSSSSSESIDLDPIIQGIADEIDLIHKLSRTIRNVGREPQNLGTSASTLSDDVNGDVKRSRIDQSDLKLIQDRFPKSNESLQKRLAAAMLLRRMGILHRRSRHRNTQSRDSAAQSPEFAQGASHQRLPPAHIRDPFRNFPAARHIDRISFVHAWSCRSWKNESSRRDTEHLLFPPPPINSILRKLKDLRNNYIANLCDESDDATTYARLRESERDMKREWAICMRGAREVICPNCCCSIPSSVAMDQKKWTDHVKSDLDVYVCLFDPCDYPYKLYNGKDEWLNHMRQHRPRWRCAARGHGVLVFFERSEYEEHMRRKHKSTQPQLAILAERSSRPSGPVFQSCPLCGEGDRPDLEEHIADHLTYLALMSIPLSNSQPADDHMGMGATLGTDHLLAGDAGRNDSDRSFAEAEMDWQEIPLGSPNRLLLH